VITVSDTCNSDYSELSVTLKVTSPGGWADPLYQRSSVCETML
jgi:hypothetical protein